jgi:outer membrane immunogenic protein
MKKVVLSITAAAALSTFAMAGGDIAPAPVATPDNSGFYFGIGYSAASFNMSNFSYKGQVDPDNPKADTDISAGLFQAGYQINEYLSIEGRWTHYLTDVKYSDNNNNGELDLSLDNIGLYLKPQYSFGNITAYALIGYGWTRADGTLTMGNDSVNFSDTDGDFQWGLGAAFHLSDHTSIFADYTYLHNGSKFEDTINGDKVGFDGDLYTFNIGMTYKF